VGVFMGLWVMSRKAMAMTALAATAVYALLWIGITVDWGWLDAMDSWTLRRFYDINAGNPGWINFWRGVSGVLGPSALRLLALVGIVIALIRRRRRMALFLTLAVILAGLMTLLAKDLSGRPRPNTALVYAASTAFPSGHALGITVAVLAATTVLWPLIAPSMRIPVLGCGAALMVLVGLSRVALNVHHPSDVIAGWALGVLCYLLCMALVPPRIGSDPRIVSQSGR